MNLELLREVVDKTGMKKVEIARRMGMSKGKFFTKLHGTASWRVEEAKKFGEVLGLTNKQLRDIFLS